MLFDKIASAISGFSCMCLFLALSAVGVRAEEPAYPLQPVAAEIAGSAANPVQDLIRRQLDGIQLRDADLVWSLGTERFHEKFDTAAEFLSHLRLELRPLYNHGAYKFLEHADTQGGLIQRVEMEDRYGEPVTVIYRLEKQEGGDWLIDSLAILAIEDGEPV